MNFLWGKTIRKVNCNIDIGNKLTHSPVEGTSMYSAITQLKLLMWHTHYCFFNNQNRNSNYKTMFREELYQGCIQIDSNSIFLKG